MVTTFRKFQYFGLTVTTIAGLCTIVFYLFILPQTLAILNTNAIVINDPLAGTEYTIGDTVRVNVMFDPTIISGKATGYFIIVSSPDQVFFQEEEIGLSYTTPFTLIRDFIAGLPAESLTIRVEMTIGSKTYYNEIDVSIIDPFASE